MRVPIQGVYQDGAGNIVVSGDVKFYEYNDSDEDNPTTIATIYENRTGGSAVATGIITTDTNGAYIAWIESSDYANASIFTLVLSKSTHTEVPWHVVMPGISTIGENILINPDFNIWQDGTSFAAVASGDYSADMFLYNKTGAMVHTISRSTNVPTVAESGHFSLYSVLIDCTTVDSSIAPGDLCIYSQKIEGYNFLPLAQQAMTLSFLHNHTKTGTYCVAFRNTGRDRSYVAEYTQVTTNIWEKATINITASPSAGTWDYAMGIGLEVSWVLAAGTDFHGTADTWESANDLSTENQVNACDNTANNFRLDQVKLEQGSIATRFVGEEIGTDLHKSKRYYEELNNAGMSGYQFGVGHCQSGTGARVLFQYEVEKRVAPTISVSSAGDFDLIQTGGSAEAVTAIDIENISVLSAIVSATVNGNIVAGNATRLKDDGNSNARIYLNSRL